MLFAFAVTRRVATITPVVNEDKATRYHRYRRRAAALSAALAATTLALLASGGGALRAREMAAMAGDRLPLIGGEAGTVAVFAFGLFLLLQAIDLPLAFYQGALLERRYGLSTQTVAQWAADHARAVVVSVGVGTAAASVVYALMRWSPAWWWAWSAGLGVASLLVVTRFAPVLFLPLVARVVPLERPGLAARLRALGARAGTPIAGVYEWQVSGHTKKASAALTGLGATRRILLSDTLLADYSDDEIEVVLAHELSHQVHQDVWATLGAQAAMIAAGCWLAGQALAAWGDAAGLRGAADPAGLALLLLVGGAWAWAWHPVLNAVSRAQERRADGYALDVTRNPQAFISAVRRLSQQNLAETDPPRLVSWLWHAHPPIRARLDAARAWRPS